jgi:hypothetical protein
MNTNTFELRALRTSDTLAALTAALASIAKLFQTPATSATNAADLLRLADGYEATQPSYAADLRAAAEAANRR